MTENNQDIEAISGKIIIVGVIQNNGLFKNNPKNCLQIIGKMITPLGLPADFNYGLDKDIFGENTDYSGPELQKILNELSELQNENISPQINNLINQIKKVINSILYSIPITV